MTALLTTRARIYKITIATSLCFCTPRPVTKLQSFPFSNSRARQAEEVAAADPADVHHAVPDPVGHHPHVPGHAQVHAVQVADGGQAGPQPRYPQRVQKPQLREGKRTRGHRQRPLRIQQQRHGRIWRIC